MNTPSPINMNDSSNGPDFLQPRQSPTSGGSFPRSQLLLDQLREMHSGPDPYHDTVGAGAAAGKGAAVPQQPRTTLRPSAPAQARAGASRSALIEASDIPNISEYKEERLEMNLVKLANKFTARRGRVVFMPQNPTQLSQPFELKPRTDLVFPVCHAGQNRSQALHAMLKMMGIRLAPPHGAISGLDPYKQLEPLNEQNYYRYLCSVTSMEGQDKILSDALKLASGQGRQRRAGNRRGKGCVALNPLIRDDADFAQVAQTRARMRRWFTTKYWNKARWLGQNNGINRLVFITFMGAAPIALTRLLESNRDCSQIVVVAIPINDPVNQTNIRNLTGAALIPAYAKTYKKMMAQYQKYFFVEYT
jgi:hypothetical protein